MNSDFAFMSISDLRRAIESKEVSPVEITSEFLERIAAIDPVLNSFVLVDEKGALKQAQEAEERLRRGEETGVLHGIPLSLKDIIETRGIETTGQSKLRAGYIPNRDAPVVRALKAAGAIILGKNTTHEFATFGPSFDLPAPPARNPWNPEHVPGGSSSGSAAAVAAGLSMGALGTDTAGSIRIPSAHCGVVGMKPTYGTVNCAGIFPLAFSLDTCGPITRSVEDNAVMLDAIATRGHGARKFGPSDSGQFQSLLSRGVEGFRIGLVRHFHEGRASTSSDQAGAIETAVKKLQSQGAIVETVELPPLEDFHACEIAIVLSEAYAIHGEDLKRRRDDFSRLFQRSITLGAFVSASEYLQASRIRKKLAAATSAALEAHDVLLMATTQGAAARMDRPHRHEFVKFPYLTSPASVTGHPAINVCCGLDSQGLPLGMQFVGRYYEEAMLYQVAQAYSEGTEFADMNPAIKIQNGPIPARTKGKEST